ncbi:MAG: hypothetical protein ACTSPY_10970 [Candidatus Helarchaeota archaeon]
MIQLTFDEIVYYSSFFSLIPLLILSIYWIWKKEYYSLVLRHLAGFLIGMLDQILMVFFNWQSTIIPIVILFDYGLYGIWFLLMPSWKKYNIKIWIPVWIGFSGIFNTILENIVRIYSYGNLNYPVGWNQVYTLIFYLCMHALGTFIASFNYLMSFYKKDSEKKSVPIN